MYIWDARRDEESVRWVLNRHSIKLNGVRSDGGFRNKERWDIWIFETLFNLRNPKQHRLNLHPQHYHDDFLPQNHHGKYLVQVD